MGFVEFLFETKKGKTIMGLLYGLGAAIVIVGALFKIMHWPGAGPMLVIGLSTEALIFAVSAFEPAHMGLDWSLVYPELAGMSEDDDKSEVKGTVTEQLDTMLEDAKIGPELIESLGAGMRNLSDNANKMSQMSDAAGATGEYTDSLKSASESVNTLTRSYEEASVALSGITGAGSAAAATGEEMQRMASTLEELNNAYSNQLQGSQEQTEVMTKMYSGIQELMTNLSDSVEDTKRYKDNIAELSTNLQALNNVYGNMLTAMNVNVSQAH